MEETEALKKQIGGDHYNKSVIQPWHIIDSHGLNFYVGNAIKYILRKKGDRVEDLQKAIHYLERQIEIEQEHEGQTVMEFDEDTQHLIDKGIIPPPHPTRGQVSVDGKMVYGGGRWHSIHSEQGRSVLEPYKCNNELYIDKHTDQER